MEANGTHGCQYQIITDVHSAYFIVPVFLVIVCEVNLVFLTLCRYPHLLTNTSLIIASLTVSDTVAASAFCMESIIFLPDVKPLFPNVMAMQNFVLGTAFGMTVLSCTHMAIVAIDRYIYIAHPFYYMKYMTRRRTLRIVLSAWALDIIFEIIPHLAYTDEKYHEKCIITHPPLEYYLIAATIYFISLVVVIVCYFKIALLGFKHKIAINARQLRNSLDYNAAVLNRKNRMAIMKSVKFFSMIVGVYFICTLPPTATIGINFICSVPEYVHLPMLWLFMVNSAMNFIIFVYMNKDFRLALKTMISSSLQRCCLQKNRV